VDDSAINEPLSGPEPSPGVDGAADDLLEGFAPAVDLRCSCRSRPQSRGDLGDPGGRADHVARRFTPRGPLGMGFLNLNSDPPQQPERNCVQGDGDDTGDHKADPKANAIAQKRWQQQEHRQARQHEPECRLR